MEVFTPKQVADALAGTFLIHCGYVHKGPCAVYWLTEALRAIRFALTFYLPLYLVGALTKYKKLLQKPLETLKPAARACFKSTMMLACMSMFGKITLCAIIKLQHGRVNQRILTVSSFMGILAAFIESPARLSEMSLYVMPRFLDTLWNFLHRRGLTVAVPGVHALLFSASMAILMYCQKFEPENIRPMYRYLCAKFFGKN